MGRNSITRNTLAKRKEVSIIAKRFFICYRLLKGEKVPSLRYDDANFGFLDQQYSPLKYRQYIKRVEEAFAQLDAVDKMFINNEFFYSDYPYWWQEYYSSSTFYRIKEKAVDNFLRLFNNGK